MEHIRPNFERPPLVEQAISAIFDPIERFSIVDYGLFWSEIKNEFPEISSSEPTVEQTELFGEVAQPDRTLRFLDSPPMPRAMFRDVQGGELVQLQADRFGFNWTQVNGQHYPHFEPVMARFESLFAAFAAYVERRQIGKIAIRQCELTNLNIIPVREFGVGYEDITQALNVDPLDLGIGFLKAETFSRTRQHRIVADNGEPIGRLHTEINPVISTQDGSKAFRLELTARSRPGLGSIEAMKEFFPIARDAINGAFCATVTQRMRHHWGETHAQ